MKTLSDLIKQATSRDNLAALTSVATFAFISDLLTHLAGIQDPQTQLIPIKPRPIRPVHKQLHR